MSQHSKPTPKGRPFIMCGFRLKNQLSRLCDSPGTWLITLAESTNQSRQVSGTSDASKTQLRLTGSYAHLESTPLRCSESIDSCRERTKDSLSLRQRGSQ